RHAMFYRKAFYFQDFGEMRRYAKVNGAPAVGLRLDCDLLRMFISEQREGRQVASQVYSFLYRKTEVERVLPLLISERARALRPEHFSHFFSDHEPWTTAAADDKAFLMESYRGPPEAQAPRRPPQPIDPAGGSSHVGLAVA